MALIEKEVFEHGKATLEIHKSHPEDLYWLQVGLAGFYLKKNELNDVHEILGALLEELTKELQSEELEEVTYADGR